MKFDPNDPKLTQYALGELHDEAQRTAVEALLNESDDARRFVDETRATAELIAETYRSEPAPQLLPRQRETIEEQLTPTLAGPGDAFSNNGELHDRGLRPRRKVPLAWLPAALAASLLLGAGLVLAPRFGSAPPQVATGDAVVDEGLAQSQDKLAANEAPESTVVPNRMSGRNGEELGQALEEGEALRRLNRADRAEPDPQAQRRGAAARLFQQPGASQAESRDESGAYRAAMPAEPAPRTPQLAELRQLGEAEGGALGRGGEDAKRTTRARLAGRPSAGKPVTGAQMKSRRDYLRYEAASESGVKKLPAQAGAAAPAESIRLGRKIAETQPAPEPMLNKRLAALPAAQPAAAPEAARPVERPTVALREEAEAGRQLKVGVKARAGKDGQAALGFDVKKLKAKSESSNASPKRVAAGLDGAGKIRDLYGRPATREKTLENEVLKEERLVDEQAGAEEFGELAENSFLNVAENSLSTFSIDVDTASYSIVRRDLNRSQAPPKDAVRIEEMINYFSYNYPQPTGEAPFSVNVEVTQCPWQPAHRLARIGLKGKEIRPEKRPPANLVFLLDVSGSMRPANKLPLVKDSMKMLVERLTEADSIGIVTYAGTSGVALPVTSGDSKGEINAAIDRLRAGGSTNGAAGIESAYELAVQNFIPEGVNRVILATDGDFNVGVTQRDALIDMIQEKAKGGVFLSVLGFGMGNLKDNRLESLADNGNGNYAYIDTAAEARKTLVEQMSGTLVTIAKDVKIQVAFNPRRVGSYRLIGYANRLLEDRDFEDDTKDAGEIGAGHQVTALYELVPPADAGAFALADKNARAAAGQKSEAPPSEKAPFVVKLRYKEPDGETSRLLQMPAFDSGRSYVKASGDTKFAAAVASFGMLLRDSQYKGNATFDSVLELASEGVSDDSTGYRAEFLGLVRKAKAVTGRP